MHAQIRRTLLPVAVALLTTFTVLGPVGASFANADTNNAGTITTQQAQAIAKRMAYIPSGYVLTSSSYSDAQFGQPAEYSLNYAQGAANGQQQFENAYLSITIDAHTGMILNYSRQSASTTFHEPAAVSPAQAQVIAHAWLRRLYGPYAASVVEVPVAPTSTTLTQPIDYTYTFERVVHGIPAPFDGFSITLSANGHLTQANANWTALTFPTFHPHVEMSQAQAIYQRSLHFYLLYAENYTSAETPTTALSYTQPSAPYPANWNTPFAGASSITTPVIDAATGQVINSDGVAQALPTEAPPRVLVPGGPSTFPGLVAVNWSQAQALAYASRLLHITSIDHFAGTSYSTQSTTSDTFSWNGPNQTQISATVDLTRGVLINYNDSSVSAQPTFTKAPGKMTVTQAAAIAGRFVRRLFPSDTGAIAVKLAPFQKFPHGLRPLFEVQFLYHGVAVQPASGMVVVDGNTGQVTSFNWQPIAGLASLPMPAEAVPLARVKANWMKAEPLSLQYLLTSPQSDYTAQQAHEQLPAARIVLVYAPLGYYGAGMTVDALTGAMQNPGQNPLPYVGPIRDLNGASNAADLTLLADDELLPVSVQGAIDPHRVMTQAAFVSLVVNALGLNNSVSLPSTGVTSMNKTLSEVSATSPDYEALIAAYTRGLLPEGQIFAPNAPTTRGYAAQILAKALGYGPLLASPQSFHLKATDAATIPSSQYAGDALAVALGMLTLRAGQFDANAGLTTNQAAQAVVQMANAYASGIQMVAPPQGGMMG